METKDILNEIIHAERAARTIYNDAMRLQTDFDDDLKSRSAELREGYYRTADKEISNFEAAALRETDETLKALNRELQSELEHVRSLYESKRESIVDALFSKVVGGDD